MSENKYRKSEVNKDFIEKLKNGDHKTFEVLLVIYEQNIRRFIFEFTRNEFDTEELTQELFIKIWTYRGNLDPEKNFSSYLFSIAKNDAKRYLRLKFERYKNETLTDEPLEISNGFVSMEEEHQAVETKLIIDMKISLMPEKRKKVFELSRYEGLSNEQIAVKMNISQRTVEKHISLALKEIRQIISSILLLF